MKTIHIDAQQAEKRGIKECSYVLQHKECDKYGQDSYVATHYWTSASGDSRQKRGLFRHALILNESEARRMKKDLAKDCEVELVKIVIDPINILDWNVFLTPGGEWYDFQKSRGGVPALLEPVELSSSQLQSLRVKFCVGKTGWSHSGGYSRAAQMRYVHRDDAPLCAYYKGASAEERAGIRALRQKLYPLSINK